MLYKEIESKNANKKSKNEFLNANMNNVGTMFGYLYRHTERERLRFLVLEWYMFLNVQLYMSKFHDNLITGHFTVPGAVKEVSSKNVRLLSEMWRYEPHSVPSVPILCLKINLPQCALVRWMSWRHWYVPYFSRFILVTWP